MTEKELTALLVELKMDPADAAKKSGEVYAANAAAAQELNTARGQLQEANDRLNGEMAEWASLTQREKAESVELRASLEQARVRATQLESRVTALAQQAGVDPKTILEGTAVITAKPEPVVQAVDTSKFVPVDQFGNALRFALDLPAALMTIQDEHRELTGQRLDTREIVNIVKANANKHGGVVDPIAIWESKYDIPAKRQAAADKKRQDEISAAEARGEERARSAAALPNATPTGRHSPVFGTTRNDQGQFVQRTSALHRPQPGSTVATAAAAIRSGKYRQGVGKPSAA